MNFYIQKSPFKNFNIKELEDNKSYTISELEDTFVDDIGLEIGIQLDKNKYLIDLYYYMLDTDYEPDNETLQKGLSNLLKLLEKWKILLSDLKINQKVILPFAFYDEYVGLLEVVNNGLNFSIDYGYTQKLNGYSVNPSKSLDIKIDEYEKENLNVILSKKELINILDESINKLKNIQPPPPLSEV